MPGPGGGTPTPPRWSAGRRSPTCTCASAKPAARLWVPITLAATLLTSCATLPAARISESPWAALAGDANLYLFADVRQARGLLEALVDGIAGFATLASPLFAMRDGEKPGRMAPLLDRAAEVYACVYLPAGGGAGSPAAVAPGYGAELAVTGRFSPDLVGLRLDWSCGWVRHEPPPPSRPYWSARGRTLEAGSPVRGLLLAAAGRPGALERMLGRRLQPATGPVERARASDPRTAPFLAGAALYACLPSRIPKSGEASVAKPATAGLAGELPLRELWLAVRREGDGYELGALAALAGEPNARALAGLVRLAAAAWLRKAGIPEVTARLRALEIVVEADGLAVRGLRLSEAELLAVLRGWLLPQAGENVGARSGS